MNWEEYWRVKGRFENRFKIREQVYLLKITILAHYSNPEGVPICNNCGEQDIDTLCIDHINGGGNRHKNDTGRRGSNMYRWLMSHDYPEDYQVLCANCNLRKTRYESWRNVELARNK